ncbi:hypothetical protein F2Q69_00012531 [Brassica cretica]|uniref:Uncharacterized protein n=1 Tax=Brassica cretica TaxID=69181 RepID=A0A8S9R1P1_BRACR|nr:hypothetical protein F2Q69_00012531 [Brassica cretica]
MRSRAVSSSVSGKTTFMVWYMRTECPWFGNFICNATMVFFCEMMIDIMKHSFIAMFNGMKPIAHSEFLQALYEQTLNIRPEDRKTNLTFVPIVPACVIGSANSQLHQHFTVDKEGTRERARYHWKDLDARFSNHLSDQTVPTSLGVSEKRSTETKSFSLEFVICVYDQPGDETTLVKQMVSDRSKLALPEYHIDLISEGSGVALLEPSRSIRRFLRFLQNHGKSEGLFRKSRTSVEFSQS